MDYPFLIDKTSVELFRFIVDSGDNDQISQSLKDMVSDRQATSKEIDQVQGSINLIDKEIENYKAQVEAAKPILETCNKILELQNKVSRYNLACETRLQLLKIKQDKSNLSENYNKTLNNSKIYKDFYDKFKTSYTKLNTLKDNFIVLHNIIGDLSDIEEKLTNLNYLKDIKKIDTSRLTQMKEIKLMLNNIEEQRKHLEVKPKATCNISEDDYNKLRLLKSYKKNHEDIKTKISSISENITAYKSSIETYNNFKDLFDVCPVCGNKIHK